MNTVKYNYSALPSFATSNLGYVYSSTSTATTVAAGSITASIGFALPIGVYIADAYVLFTPSAAATHILKLGINTANNAIGVVSFNYTTENTLVASALPHSIIYNYILSVSAATTYYFVFNTNINGNVNGTFSSMFVRIA